MRGAFKKKKVSFHSAHFRKEPFLVFFFTFLANVFSFISFKFSFLQCFQLSFPLLIFFFFFLFFYPPPKKKERRD